MARLRFRHPVLAFEVRPGRTQICFMSVASAKVGKIEPRGIRKRLNGESWFYAALETMFVPRNGGGIVPIPGWFMAVFPWSDCAITDW